MAALGDRVVGDVGDEASDMVVRDDHDREGGLEVEGRGVGDSDRVRAADGVAWAGASRRHHQDSSVELLHLGKLFSVVVLLVALLGWDFAALRYQLYNFSLNRPSSHFSFVRLDLLGHHWLHPTN